MIRLIYVAHQSPGRVRLRLPYLRHEPDVVEALAERLARTEGVEEVQQAHA